MTRVTRESKAIGRFEHALFDAGFSRGTFAHLGAERDVYELGSGPAVIVLSEMPGITPPTIELCRRLAAADYAVVLPQLVGEPGAPISPGAILGTLGRLCVSREFSLLKERAEAPITEWLRALARHVHRTHGGPGVGVIGMCFTGGFALAMMLDESVMAPVLSQPSLPAPLTSRKRRALGLDDAALARVKARCRDEDLCVLGLRFTNDALSPRERFTRLERELGRHFLRVEIDSSLGNPHGIKPWAHSVLTNDFVDEPSHPTRAALDQVLALFERQLRTRVEPSG